MKPSSPSNAELLRNELSHEGARAIPYANGGDRADWPFELHTYRPHGYTSDRPVIIVQHGMLRNGDDYRDFWIPAADRHKLLIVAPTFSDANWPGAENYNNGRAFASAGTPRDLDQWTYALVGGVVADIRASGIADCKKIYLFGHSAGGQFTHRLLSSQPHAPFHAATASNAGWYTLPTFDHPFPEGLDGVGLDEDHLVRLLAYPLTILAGDQDISTDEPHLPSDPAAKRQGPHRFARAHNYFEAGRQEAQRRGVPFGWKLQAVPGIGHDGKAMSAVCASLWFDGAMPSDEEMARLAGATSA